VGYAYVAKAPIEQYGTCKRHSCKVFSATPTLKFLKAFKKLSNCSSVSNNDVLVLMKAQPIPLGMVICQRKFHLYTPDGQPRSVIVRLGMPVPTSLDGCVLAEGSESFGIFRCPVQITGLNHDERVDGIFGEDPFVALQYAIDFIGDRLNQWSTALELTNRQRNAARDSWIWTYPPHQES
jgi:hypothetical protein